MRRLAPLTWTIRAGLTIAAIGLVWMNWPAQDADASYIPNVSEPAYTSRPRPRILIDEGHLNMHTAGGRYRPFARLLQRDGFLVSASDGRITADALGAGNVFVTANALGYKGLMQHLANSAGLERAIQFDVDAFTGDEAQQLESWVSAGGRALIVADHAPAGAASRRLAAAFGVEMTNWWAEDRGGATITFTRANGGLADHPITNGRTAAERIATVMTFTGQALRPPAGARVILRFTAEAREYPFRKSRENEGRSAEGLAQAVALAHGRGRVVIMGEAAALTAQRVETAGAPPTLFGINTRDVDNQQFALNVVHWLVGILN